MVHPLQVTLNKLGRTRGLRQKYYDLLFLRRTRVIGIPYISYSGRTRETLNKGNFLVHSGNSLRNLPHVICCRVLLCSKLEVNILRRRPYKRRQQTAQTNLINLATRVFTAVKRINIMRGVRRSYHSSDA